MVNVLIKPLYEVSCWNKTTQFISHPFLMISRRIENNQILRFESGIWFSLKKVDISLTIV